MKHFAEHNNLQVKSQSFPSYRSTNLRYKNNELGRYKKTRLTLDLYIMMKTLAGNVQNNHYGEGNLQNWMGGNGVKKKKNIVQFITRIVRSVMLSLCLISCSVMHCQ